MTTVAMPPAPMAPIPAPKAEEIELVKNEIKAPPSSNGPPPALPSDAQLKEFQENMARITHANTISVMINNSAHVFSTRVSADILKNLKEQAKTGQTPSVPTALEQLNKFLKESSNLFRFNADQAIGVMKGITDGTMKCLFEVFKSNPHLSVNDVKDQLEDLLLTQGWAPIIKQVPDDLVKACGSFLAGDSLKTFINVKFRAHRDFSKLREFFFAQVRTYNDGELVPWIDGKPEEQRRTPAEQKAYEQKCQQYNDELKKAIEEQALAFSAEAMPLAQPMPIHAPVAQHGQVHPANPGINPGFGHVIPGMRLKKARKRLRVFFKNRTKNNSCVFSELLATILQPEAPANEPEPTPPLSGRLAGRRCHARLQEKLAPENRLRLLEAPGVHEEGAEVRADHAVAPVGVPVVRQQLLDVIACK